MSTVSLIQAITEAFRDGTRANNTYIGGLAELARRFKTTNRASIEFTRNLMYGFGGFKAITNTVTALQSVAKSVQMVKGVVGVALPVFNLLNETLGITEKASAVAGVIGSSVNLGQMQETGENLAKKFDPLIEKLDEGQEKINQLWDESGVSDVVSSFKALDFKGVFANLTKGGPISSLLRLAILIYGVIGKIAFGLLKGLVIAITKTLAIFLPYLTYVLGAIIAAMVVVHLVYQVLGVVFDTVKAIWAIAWPTVSTLFGHIGDFLGVFFNAIGGIFGFIFGNTSLEEMLFGIFDLIPAFLDMFFSSIATLIIGIPVLIYAVLHTVIGSIWSRAVEWWNNSGKLDILMAVVGLVAFFTGGAFLVLGIAIVYYAVKWLWKKLSPYFSWTAIKKFFADWWVDAVGGLMKKIGEWWDSIDYFANGGVSTGGMAVVGEKGAELVNLPRGARIHSNTQSRKMASTAQGGTIIHNNITINARDTSDGELRRIAEKISSMVNNKINRTTSSRTLG